jgi:hypothetical protein
MGNHYPEGNYAPVRHEQTVTQLAVAVTGTIPAHLDGRYLRTRSPRSTRRPITGSPATEWSTECAYETAWRSGTAIAGSARPPLPGRWASPAT